MKRGKRLLLGLTIAAAAVHAQSEISPTRASGASIPLSLTATQGRNSISGSVFGESGRPITDVYVELLNDVGSTISRAKTSGGGRYSFYNLPNGQFQIRALPYGTDYLEQTQAVSLIPVSALPGSGAVSQQVDFYLRINVKAIAGPLYAPGTIFVQEVPMAAKNLYDKGVAELKDKKESEGFNSLRRSLEIFPTYFDALDRLGTEYAVRGHQDKRYFEAAHVLLSKAIEINPRSASSSFGLGFSQYHLGLVDQSIESLQRAVTNYNKSINGYLWLGIALKRAGKLDQAETALKRASEFSKGKEADAHWHLAQLYSDQKRYAEAVSELELLLKNKPDARDAEKIRQLVVKLKEKAAKAG